MSFLPLISGCTERSPHTVSQIGPPSAYQNAMLRPLSGVALHHDQRAKMLKSWDDGAVVSLRDQLRILRHEHPEISREAADSAFEVGNYSAGFHEYSGLIFAAASVATIGGYYEIATKALQNKALQPRNRVTAFLLTGDASAACGRFHVARDAWRSALQDNGGSITGDVWYPEWTSALRRLIAFRNRAEAERMTQACVTDEEQKILDEKRIADADQGAVVSQQGWKLFFDGHASAALAKFDRAISLLVRERSTKAYVSSERGIVISAIFAQQDERAATELDAINSMWRESPGTQDVFRGDWNGGFLAYGAETATELQQAEVDPLIAKGVAEAVHGHLKQAISIWGQPADNDGRYDLNDIQTALIGIAYARSENWPLAVDAWINAGCIGRLMPQIDSLVTGNVIAFDM